MNQEVLSKTFRCHYVIKQKACQNLNFENISDIFSGYF